MDCWRTYKALKCCGKRLNDDGKDNRVAMKMAAVTLTAMLEAKSANKTLLTQITSRRKLKDQRHFKINIVPAEQHKQAPSIEKAVSGDLNVRQTAEDRSSSQQKEEMQRDTRESETTGRGGGEKGKRRS